MLFVWSLKLAVLTLSSDTNVACMVTGLAVFTIVQ